MTNPTVAPLEFQVLDALFRSDHAALERQFAGGIVNIDAPRVGRNIGSKQTLGLAERWPGLFNVKPGEAKLRPRHSFSENHRFVIEVIVDVASPEGALVHLPIGLVGQRTAEGLLQEVRIYHYEKAVSGQPGHRPSAFPSTEEERPGVADDMPGVNAEYFKAVNGGDVEGALALFTSDAWIEVGGQIFNTPAQRRTIYEFFLKHEAVQLLFSCMTHDGSYFGLEWTAGHGNREAGLAVYESSGKHRDKIASIRMYDFFDPSVIPGLIQAG